MTRTRPTTIPARHPDDPASVPVLGPVAKLLGIQPPNDAEWAAMGEALTIGDRPMDELVEWMYTAGMGTARPLFDRALEYGIDSIPDAPEPLRAFFTQVENPPAWVDWKRITLGERIFQAAGLDGIYLARDVPFLGGFVASGINRTLLLTNTGKSGATGGGQRFAETMKWALDVISDGGMRPGGIGFRSTLHVRLIHTFVRRHVANLPEWRAEEWGVPVNQTDMAVTMLGALYAPALTSIMMGNVFTPRELDAIVHLTRYVGWVMGIEERYLPTGFLDATKQLYHYLSVLTAPDETSARLARPMAEDPLTWYYPHLAGLRRRIAWAQHLSISTTFLGRESMRQLGLPTYMPPWYPMAKFPVNVARSGLGILVPGWRTRQARAGLRAQHAFMTTLIGPKDEGAIGGSVTYIDHAA
ncbi:oxygenase MpaB family protein [Nocardia sp. CDC160]|uniref:oxygenase MpaB family protein n=1 Tax=Nocardia sp. CDC160 TaxID=3112166 RepID=UPI002DB9C9B8|nr:oxygenase MpaB family protein [Nocardia sp. CDC160]MEC3920578.1 oxygenase MpaB family protein [Nocardia sp. CDC160]